ncbi:MAG TPA: GntR family transcriptional regulator [Micromonosporaceae bacterium]|nr:GntR family transcriptional regulator [Micromonosporaceae bacterium]
MNARPTELNNDAVPGLPRLVLPNNGSAPTRGSMPEMVAGALREAILDGALEPGAWLREAEVARELNVSRTPVRDAFRILAAEGLVTINANQGAVVSAMTSDDVLELYVMREVLEALAARLAARRAARRCLQEFSALIPEMKLAGERGDHRELSRLNFQFHAIIRDAAGNRYLERALTQVQNAARRFPDPTLGLPGRVAESIAEHVALADAISQGDAATAEKLSVEHMRHLSELRIRMLLHT